MQITKKLVFTIIVIDLFFMFVFELLYNNALLYTIEKIQKELKEQDKKINILIEEISHER